MTNLLAGTVVQVMSWSVASTLEARFVEANRCLSSGHIWIADQNGDRLYNTVT